MPYSIVKVLPWNHFGRKNLGYLFAVHHGARVIYDTDDDNELLLDSELPESTLPHLTSSKTDRFFRLPLSDNASDHQLTAFNPYPSFGARQAWPRGLPLDEIRSSSSTVTCNGSVPSLLAGDIVDEMVAMDVGVIQSLANHDPDVDAIYRLSPLPLPFSFDADVNGGLPIGLAHHNGLMSPYNAQATLHFWPAFWGMLLPISVHGRVSDIWRGYFAQRLFWETGLALAFAAPWVEQIRNPHDYLADFEAESDLYARSGALIRYLSSQWTCSETAGIDACMMELYVEMYRTGIVEHPDLELSAAWLADLRAIGYDFPTRLETVRDKRSTMGRVPAEPHIYSIDVTDFSVADQAPQTRAVARLTIPRQVLDEAKDVPSQLTCKQAWASIYLDAAFERPYGVKAATIATDGDKLVVDISIAHGSDVDDPLFVKLHCLTEAAEAAYTTDVPGSGDALLVTFRLLQPVAFLPVFEDILLIINFNHGQDYKFIPELLSTYGQAFPNHMFIGSDSPAPELEQLIADQVHVVREVRNGWAMPIAMEYAMEARPDVKGGYFLINNDVAMKFWKWQHHNWDKVAGSTIQCYHNLSLPHDDPAWGQWHFHQEVSHGIISKVLAKFNASDTDHVWSPCGDRILYSMFSDAFYVPSRLQARYSRLVHSLEGIDTMILFEAVTPMLLSMTAPSQEWASFHMRYCWTNEERARCPEEFLQDTRLSMLHPWKLDVAGVPTAYARLPKQKLWYSV